MILDSSTGNLIRETEPKPSERQHARGEDTEGQIILDSSAFRAFKAKTMGSSPSWPSFQILSPTIPATGRNVSIFQVERPRLEACRLTLSLHGNS